MYKKISENAIKEKVAELMAGHHWRRISLLVLLLLPRGKLASRYYIYNKIKEWELWKKENDVSNSLSMISKALNCLFMDEYLRREDLSRFSEKNFNKICEKRVLGRREVEFAQRWVQSVFYLSTKGRKLAKETLFPRKNKKDTTFFRRLFKLRKSGNNKTL